METAPIEGPLRATLRMLRKLTHEHAVDADDMRAVLAAGVTRDQIEDALGVCFAFNTVSRLADAFGFFQPGPEASKRERNTCSGAATVDDEKRMPFDIPLGVRRVQCLPPSLSKSVPPRLSLCVPPPRGGPPYGLIRVRIVSTS
jgi:hypothetical protein